MAGGGVGVIANGFGISDGGVGDEAGDIGEWLNKTRGPFAEAQQVIDDHHVAVGAGAGTATENRALNGANNFSGDFVGHRFEQQKMSASGGEEGGFFHNAAGVSNGATLREVSPLLQRALRKQSDVSAHGDARGAEGGDDFPVPRSASSLTQSAPA